MRMNFFPKHHLNHTNKKTEIRYIGAVIGLLLFAFMAITLPQSPHPAIAKSEKNTTYTDYRISLDEAVDIQVNDGATPTTDIYQNDPVYINKNHIELVHPTIRNYRANIHTAPDHRSEIAYQFTKTTPVHITDIMETSHEKWYELKYKTNTYYVPARDVAVWQIETKANTEAYQEATMDAHVFETLKPGQIFPIAPATEGNDSRPRDSAMTLESTVSTQATPSVTNKESFLIMPTKTSRVFPESLRPIFREVHAMPQPAFFHEPNGASTTRQTLQNNRNKDGYIATTYKVWRKPNTADVKKHLDPNNHHKMQHIRLDKSIGATTEQLNDILEGNGILEDQGKAFKKGSKKAEINEAYLIAHAIHETGAGTSELAQGVEVGKNKNNDLELVTDQNREDLSDIKKVYNMYGIGAADACPVECGAAKAYENKWTTPEKAIKNGADWIKDSYIHNNFNQNTLYKMKWNPEMADGQKWKQYATDISWATKQTAKLEEIYEQLPDPKYYYDIPVYEDD